VALNDLAVFCEDWAETGMADRAPATNAAASNTIVAIRCGCKLAARFCFSWYKDSPHAAARAWASQSAGQESIL
jgi:hypothetical protein